MSIGGQEQDALASLNNIKWKCSHPTPCPMTLLRDNLLPCLACSIFLHALVLGFIPSVPRGGAQTGANQEKTVILARLPSFQGRHSAFDLEEKLPVLAAKEKSSQVPAETGAHPLPVPPPLAPALFRYEDYLPPSQLTAPPRPLTEIDPNPPEFNAPGLVGEAELLLLINEAGKVDAVVVTNSTLPSVIVDHAIDRFRDTDFSPGKVDETGVKSRVRIRLSTPSMDEIYGNPLSAKERSSYPGTTQR